MKVIRTMLGTIGFAVAMLISKKVHGAEFKANEFSLKLYGTGSIETEARAKEAVSVGAGLGADYFVTKGLGFGARAELSDFSHSVIDRGTARVIARAPLWDAVAPYGYVEGGYNLEEDRWLAGAGGGVELRLKKLPVGVFAEAGLETTTRGEAYGRLSTGINIPFGK